MAFGFTSVGGKNPDVLITSINQQLNTASPKETLTYREIAYADSGSSGVFAQYPMRVTSVKERKMGPVQDRNFNDAEVISVSVQAGRIDGPADLFPIDPLYDLYGLLVGQSYDMVRQAFKIWDRDLATTINSNLPNVSSYDNLPFFGTHSANPGKIGAATFSNDIVATADEAGFVAAWQTMQTIPGFDDTLINADMGVPIILCPNLTIKLAFDKIVNEGLIVKQVAGAAASETTQLVGAAKTILMPELVDPTNPLTNRRWYMLNTRHSMRRAFIVRDFTKPQFKLTGPNDVFAHTKNARALYYTATGGSGYGLPQLAVRCTIP